MCASVVELPAWPQSRNELRTGITCTASEPVVIPQPKMSLLRVTRHPNVDLCLPTITSDGRRLCEPGEWLLEDHMSDGRGRQRRSGVTAKSSVNSNLEGDLRNEPKAQRGLLPDSPSECHITSGKLFGARSLCSEQIATLIHPARGLASVKLALWRLFLRVSSLYGMLIFVPPQTSISMAHAHQNYNLSVFATSGGLMMQPSPQHVVQKALTSPLGLNVSGLGTRLIFGLSTLAYCTVCPLRRVLCRSIPHGKRCYCLNPCRTHGRETPKCRQARRCFRS